MYLIFEEIIYVYTYADNRPPLQYSEYYFISNYSEERISSNYRTEVFIPEECRINGKLFKMWTKIAGDFNSPQEAFNDLLTDRKTPQKKFHFIENLEDARNILNVLREELVESYRCTPIENRSQINYYILNVNIREIVKILPNEFVEVSDVTNVNYEEVPFFPDPILDILN